MGVAEEMRERLQTAFEPTHLTIEDESERHRGHAGYQEGGESHWRVGLRSEVFRDMSRIERHRAVHAALGPDLVGRIHALALKLDVPEEAA
ncbi:MAG: BolA family protein [Pseudomonadota bacterium]